MQTRGDVDANSIARRTSFRVLETCRVFLFFLPHLTPTVFLLKHREMCFGFFFRCREAVLRKRSASKNPGAPLSLAPSNVPAVNRVPHRGVCNTFFSARRVVGASVEWVQKYKYCSHRSCFSFFSAEKRNAHACDIHLTLTAPAPRAQVGSLTVLDAPQLPTVIPPPSSKSGSALGAPEDRRRHDADQPGTTQKSGTSPTLPGAQSVEKRRWRFCDNARDWRFERGAARADG